MRSAKRRKSNKSSLTKKIKKNKLRKIKRRTTRKETPLLGFDAGFNPGYDLGHDAGYAKGKYDGGDAVIDRILPSYQILPDVSINEIIAAGIESLKHRIVHLQSSEEVGDEMIRALKKREPFSLVRLGDGELLTLAQEGVMSDEEIRREGSFLEYAGVHIPDINTKNRLLEAIRNATVVGIPKLREKNYQPLAMDVFKANGIDYNGLRLTDSLVNYYLYQTGYLSKILHEQKVLVIGNTATPLAEILSANHQHIAGVITPVNGVRDIDRILYEVQNYDFDIALVPSGIASVIICEQIANRYGKVALDFGHLANSMINGNAPFK